MSNKTCCRLPTKKRLFFEQKQNTFSLQKTLILNSDQSRQILMFTFLPLAI